MSHNCHAYECKVRVPQKMFMCRAHWFALSKHDRNLIWKHYTPGQESGAGITDEYAAVAKMCVQMTAEREGKTIPDDAPELLVYDMTIRGTPPI